MPAPIAATGRRAIADPVATADLVANRPGRAGTAPGPDHSTNETPGCLPGVSTYRRTMGRMMRGALLAASLVLIAAPAIGQEQAPNRRDFTVVARDHRFSPDRLEVSQDDLVRITLQSEDRPLSFAIDAYRIVKRVGAGQSLSFEFRADQPGTFEFYCNLTADAACAEMRGTLVVRAKGR